MRVPRDRGEGARAGPHRRSGGVCLSGSELAVDSAMRSGDHIWPGRIHSVTVGDVRVHWLATTLDPRRNLPPGGRPARSRRGITGVCRLRQVAPRRSDRGDLGPHRAPLRFTVDPDWAFENLVARTATEDVVLELTGTIQR